MVNTASSASAPGMNSDFRKESSMSKTSPDKSSHRKMQPDEESKLVQLCLQNDSAAKELLFAEVEREVMSHFTFDEDERMEIIADTLAESYCALVRGKYNESHPFTAYAIGICKVVMQKRRREEAFHALKYSSFDDLFPQDDDQEDGESDSPLHEDMNPAYDPAYVVERADGNEYAKKHLSAALEILSQDEKNLLYMRLDKVPYKEISQCTGKTVDALESQYRRLIKKLRCELEHMGYDDGGYWREILPFDSFDYDKVIFRKEDGSLHVRRKGKRASQKLVTDFYHEGQYYDGGKSNSEWTIVASETAMVSDRVLQSQ